MKPTTALMITGVLAPASYALGRDLLPTLNAVDTNPYAAAAEEARQAGQERRQPQIGSEFLVNTYNKTSSDVFSQGSTMSQQGLTEQQVKEAVFGRAWNAISDMVRGGARSVPAPSAAPTPSPMTTRDLGAQFRAARDAGAPQHELDALQTQLRTMAAQQRSTAAPAPAPMTTRDLGAQFRAARDAGAPQQELDAIQGQLRTMAAQQRATPVGSSGRGMFDGLTPATPEDLRGSSRQDFAESLDDWFSSQSRPAQQPAARVPGQLREGPYATIEPRRTKMSVWHAGGMDKEAAGGFGRVSNAIGGIAGGITDDLGRAATSLFSRNKVPGNMGAQNAYSAAQAAYDLRKIELEKIKYRHGLDVSDLSDTLARNQRELDDVFSQVRRNKHPNPQLQARLAILRQDNETLNNSVHQAKGVLTAHERKMYDELSELEAVRTKAKYDLDSVNAAQPDPQYTGGGSRLIGAGIGGAALLGGAAALDAVTDSGYADALGYEFNKRMSPLTSRIRLDETVAQSYAQQLSKNFANMTANVVAQTGGALANAPGAVSRMNMAEQLLDTDEVLRTASPDQRARATQAYQSMSRIAPDIAQDPMAAANFMRESVVTGNGPDYATIGALAMAQKNILGNPVTWTKGIPGAGGV